MASAFGTVRRSYVVDLLRVHIAITLGRSRGSHGCLRTYPLHSAFPLRMSAGCCLIPALSSTPHGMASLKETRCQPSCSAMYSRTYSAPCQFHCRLWA
eukprot:4406633-Amphidinium_carterae.1